MRVKSFTRRLFFGYLVIFICTVIIAGFTAGFLFRKAAIKIITANLEKQVFFLHTRLENGQTDFEKTCNMLSASGERVRFIIFHADGDIIYDTQTVEKSFPAEFGRTGLAKQGVSIFYSHEKKTEFLYVSKKSGSGVMAGALYELKNLDENLSEFNNRFLLFCMIFFIVCLFLFFFWAKIISAPLTVLSGEAARIGSGDFSVCRYTRTYSEFDNIFESLNSMISHLQGLFSELQTEKTELARVINAMQEGILVVQTDGKIILFNPPAESLFKTRLRCSHAFWEEIRDAASNEFINTAVTGKKSFNAEITFGQQTYLACCSWVPERNTAILVFHDITERVHLETNKRTFLSNLSHELRTPLTSINGFVETVINLLGQKVPDTDRLSHFMEIIRRNVQRLALLVADILTLGSLEEPNYKLEIKPVNPSKIINSCFSLVSQKAAEKKLLLENKIPGELMIAGDEFRLEQVFVNLIDNAVKYTDYGKIEITADYADHNAVIRVKDSGVGIKADNIDKLFSRFFVADKSRSREKGGTGLGLSIVKKIVLMHGGSVTCESTPGQGSCFTVTLPGKFLV